MVLEEYAKENGLSKLKQKRYVFEIEHTHLRLN